MENKKTYNLKQVIVIRKELQMRKGKIAAQVAHASSRFLMEKALESIAGLQPFYTDIQKEWMESGNYAKVVCWVKSEQELLNLCNVAAVKEIPFVKQWDNGATEFHGVKTLTCVCFGPWNSDDLSEVTGHLPLL